MQTHGDLPQRAAGTERIAVEQHPGDRPARDRADEASTCASTITDTTTGNAPNPIARSVAISTVRVLTAEYIVLSAPNSAPTAMMPPTVVATISSSAATFFD